MVAPIKVDPNETRAAAVKAFEEIGENAKPADPADIKSLVQECSCANVNRLINEKTSSQAVSIAKRAVFFGGCDRDTRNEDPDNPPASCVIPLLAHCLDESTHDIVKEGAEALRKVGPTIPDLVREKNISAASHVKDSFDLVDEAMEDWKAGRKEIYASKMEDLILECGGTCGIHLIKAIAATGDPELKPALKTIAFYHRNLTEDVIKAWDQIKNAVANR